MLTGTYPATSVLLLPRLGVNRVIASALFASGSNDGGLSPVDLQVAIVASPECILKSVRLENIESRRMTASIELTSSKGLLSSKYFIN